MTRDPEQIAHQEWLGYVQPVGLVVSIPALLAAQAHVNRNIAEAHQRFLACLPRDKADEVIHEIRDFAEFTQKVFGWESGDLQPWPKTNPLPTEFAALEVALPEYNETLRPTHVVREFKPSNADHPWMMLIQCLPTGTKLDSLPEESDQQWHATPHAKFERLLRETEVPIGILCNSTHLRLVYAPRGETSGYMTFVVSEMAQVAGRPIFAALHMLLCVERAFGIGMAYPDKQCLSGILADSRKYQAVVSTQLAEQVLAALYELLRGFQAADDRRRGELLREVLAADPNHVYHGLLTVLMRLVFILYAEDRGLLSSDPVYSNFYSVTGLFERLRADAGRYPDTMDQRYGAWAQLLTLFRLIYEGGSHAGFRIPARKGYLFDPDRYNFLEGRQWKTSRRMTQTCEIPRVSDGVIFRVLSNLLILEGERLSYRTLDVEQIGSVYETIMGFNLEVAQGRSIAIKPAKSNGAPATVNLEQLLATKPADRAKWLAEQADQKLTGQAADGLRQAATLDDLLAALERKTASNVTPNIVPKGAMVFQPSDERRRSGSHYTPRSLTEPIVRTTLRPILQRFGDKPTPEQILELNICDFAMGSGAFLVETCRQLGDMLVKAWHVHNCVPKLPPDEDELLHARRLIAQRCLYGVDKNPMAVDLAKLSLWLATLAKDHPFTFLDHSLRAGDSLVGLSREQIENFTWELGKPTAQLPLIRDPIAERMRTVTEYRQRILAARDDKPYEQLRQELDVADEALSLARLTGDCVIAAYFSAGKDRERVAKLDTLARQLVQYLGPQRRIEDRQPLTAAVASLHGSQHPIQPFHWQIEFPEVFTVDARGKPTGGFDAIVGNPPFAGKNTLIAGNCEGYLDWLKTLHDESHGNADLVAHFFRRAFNLLRSEGCFGLIATNTIGQGDTRSTGLRWICTHGGTIYAARKRLKWPGQAAVMVSVVNVCRGSMAGPFVLEGREVPTITAYLFHAGGHDTPSLLLANTGTSFIGSYVLGMGFTFDDQGNEGVANPIRLMHELIAKDHRNSERIFPYIGGEEINDSPTHSHHRYVINFEEMSEEEARQWPDLMHVLETQVKPERQKLGNNGDAKRRKQKWWLWGRYTPALFAAMSGKTRVMINSQVSSYLVFAFVSADIVPAHTTDVFTIETHAFFAVMQSSVHNVWGLFFASSLEDRLRYNTSDCYETFPFPTELDSLETAGREYYAFRAALMVRNNEGLTKTYNRFHDPHETSPDILKLRELHAEMDRAVLEAYGWHDLAQTATCEFLLDYEDDEDDDEGSAVRVQGSGRQKKKPWRYRWPDDFRDEVLARLLALNQERAKQERLAGQAAEAASTNSVKRGGRGRSSGKKRSAAKRPTRTLDLFQEGET